MSELWKIIQTHLDQTGVREAEFARRIGTSPTTVNSWKNRGVRSLPERRLLEAVANEIPGVSYRQVLAAVLSDIGYADPSVAIGRRHHGAWELGPELMVQLAMEAKGVESAAWDATSFSEDNEIEDVIHAAEELARIGEELASTAQTVAELGMGGASALQTAVHHEREKRKAARSAARDMGRRLATAARKSATPTKGELEKQAADSRGEEPDPDGPEGGA
ncbi:hypothetical protein [Gordonia alkanivorans]|uniref:hypothetical protein n=1 Tax=Gordonia alkanivorans TaxID=84096 RepID=UPI0024B83979|nr:hypothetical protein [Gordonia alkanivorans]MDJ0006467.1 hypothetical protein [Gordonia alkanivorans]MDJ0492095.1 hypothetical protein [Gordonia alkanivorans]